jgi:O-antigen ligase
MLTVYFFFTVVLARHPIRAHIIWAAITVYLLLGVLYAIAFEIIGTVIVGSVIFNTNPAQVLTTSDYIYYSYSTLFTLS